MSISVSSASPASAVAAVPKATDRRAPVATTPAQAKTSATFSKAAIAALAAEANESPAQTAREAQGNDPQAKRLMARETAAKAAAAPHRAG